MITEDYASFETAKLLKEKGFDETNCHTCYKYNGGFCKNRKSMSGVDTMISYQAPTLQMAMKWLRKEHNLAISTSITADGWSSYVSQIKLDSAGFVVDIIDGIDNGNIPNYDTYEEVCEAAINYCLEKIL